MLGFISNLITQPSQLYFGRDYGTKGRIAWKTGTSYGNRDAWAVGTALDWTIAVWLGNFSGQENKQVCSRCWERGNLTNRLQVVYPPAVVEYLQARGNNVSTSLLHKKSCPTVSDRNPIEFIYPQSNNILAIPRGTDGDYQQITFRIAHAQENSKLFWYLDQQYLGATTGDHKRLLLPEDGRHRLHVVDKEGHQREIQFQVKRNE